MTLASSFLSNCSAMAAALASDLEATGQALHEHQRSATIAREASHSQAVGSTLKSDDEIDMPIVYPLDWIDVRDLVAIGIFMLGVLAVCTGVSDSIIAGRLQ